MSDSFNQSTNSRLIAADQVEGTAVFDRHGEKLGLIKDIYIDKRSGQAEFASMAFGGVLGVGEKYHPLPWQALDYSAELHGFVVDLDKDVLEGSPAYAGDELLAEDSAWDAAVRAYYGERILGVSGGGFSGATVI